jgi:hypothetical protein
MLKHKKSAWLGAGLTVLCSLLMSGRAMAGPPYRTDDPEPVDYQHWEYYTFTTGTHIREDTSGVGPAAEFNYGLIPYGQKIKTAAKMAVVQASTIKQLNAPFRTAPHGSA